MPFGLKHAITGGLAPPKKGLWRSLLEAILGIGPGGPSRSMEAAGHVGEAWARHQELKPGFRLSGGLAGPGAAHKRIGMGPEMWGKIKKGFIRPRL